MCRYKRETVVAWIILYNALNLKQLKLVTNADLPSLTTSKTHEISCRCDVNGAAMDASASDREIPTSADFNAAQSLAPSPQNETQ